MGQLLDLTSFARQVEGEIGKAPANVAPVTVIGGKTYAIPWYIMPAFWYVWRDEFEKKKVKLPTTFEEAKVAAAALNRPNESFYGLGQSWNRTADGYGVMQSLMYSYGVGWANKDGKYQSIKNAKMQTVMKWATDIYKEGIQPADTLSWTGSQNNEAFIAKKIAQTSNGPSITFALENALAKAADAKDKKMREEAVANHVALPHPGGPDGRRCWGLALSFGVVRGHRLARPRHRGGGRGAGQQRADRRAGQGHRRQVVGRPGHRLGRQEDQGDLRHAGDVAGPPTTPAPRFSCSCRCWCSSSA